jgi:hypothetical protein
LQIHRPLKIPVAGVILGIDANSTRASQHGNSPMNLNLPFVPNFVENKQVSPQRS